jgi:hypothetical protein
MTRATLGILTCLLAGAGCRTVEYSDPSGRTLRVTTPIVFSTKIGHAKYTRTDGKNVETFEIDDYSQEQRLTDLAGKLADKIP